jgi:hypothetical protein
MMFREREEGKMQNREEQLGKMRNRDCLHGKDLGMTLHFHRHLGKNSGFNIARRENREESTITD